MAYVYLLASPDDYLLETRVREALASASSELGGVEPEILREETTPEELAVELCSPSLFAPQRVLFAPDIRSWLDIPARRGRGGRDKASKVEVDADPVVRVINEGLSEGTALVMAAVCGEKPKGPLAKAVEEVGTLRWISLPPQPKPWEDVSLSGEQCEVLREVLAREVGEVRFTPEAERLLFDRLGFAPRLLAQEGRKLAAASAAGRVDEDLVRALCFPKERSLDVVWDALLERKAAPVLDIITAAAAGLPVRDRHGKIMTSDGVPIAVFGQGSLVFQRLLYLRLMATENGFVDEMAPERTDDRYWYPSQFKNGIGPKLVELLEADAPSPLIRSGSKPPSLFMLGGLFRGAGRYRTSELERALAELGTVETALRGDLAVEALSVWFTSILG
ncbi:MAG: hypothetical protein IFK91_00465 [Acidobacteria bacterium]|nr:hypothetical protein [Candidatus Sulfomarinibacter sp. MAG AM1]